MPSPNLWPDFMDVIYRPVTPVAILQLRVRRSPHSHLSPPPFRRYAASVADTATTFTDSLDVSYVLKNLRDTASNLSDSSLDYFHLTFIPVYTFQWQRCDAAGTGCVDIAGETGAAYSMAAEDTGNRIRCRITATNGLGSNSAYTPVTEIVMATGLTYSGPDTHTVATRPRHTLVKLGRT